MILLGVVGFPLTLIGSWFIESPWKGRRWTAVAGDLLIIVAIAMHVIQIIFDAIDKLETGLARDVHCEDGEGNPADGESDQEPKRASTCRG